MSTLILSFKEAARRILLEAKEPLTPREIVEEALARALVKTDGATPDASMAAQLYVDVQKNPSSPFKKVGKGKFALREQEESAGSAELIIEKQNRLVREALKAKLCEMDAYQFEFLVGDLLKKLGYVNVEVTKRAGDKGIDVVADLTLEGITNVKTVVQVKRYKIGNNISGSVVAQLRGSAEVDQRGLIITTSDFTKDAIAEGCALNKMPVSLINGEKLVTLLIKNEIGVKKELHPVYSLEKDYFENQSRDETTGPSDGKNRGLWPMPGGATAYAASLFKVLAAVEGGCDTRDSLSKWFMETFEVVKSQKTAAGYVGVPRVMGFTRVDGSGKIKLTEEGVKALNSRDLAYVYSVFAKNVFAIEEIVAFLRTSIAPQDDKAVLEFLRENLDVEWTTMAQVNFRLLWLANLGIIRKMPDGYVLAGAKKDAAVPLAHASFVN